MARRATATFTDGLSGWLRSALPGVVIEAPDEERGRRDRVVDATIYLGAFAISAATLAGTWEMHRPGCASWTSSSGSRRSSRCTGGAPSRRRDRRFPRDRDPHYSGANLAATFNAAIRARGRDLAVIAGLLIAWAFASPLLYPPGGYWANAGACVLVTGVVLGQPLRTRAARAAAELPRAQGDRAAEEARAAERRRIAREMHDVLAHRLSLLSAAAGAPSFTSSAEEVQAAEAAGVIRESAKTALEEPRSVIGVLREDSGESLTQAPQPTLADLAALVEESRSRHADHRLNRAGRRSAASRRRTHRVPDRAGGPDERSASTLGAAVTLTVRAPDGDLQVEVRSLARSRGRAAARGRTTTGLAERVFAAGGTLEHGVTLDGAFVLRASLPR